MAIAGYTIFNIEAGATFNQTLELTTSDGVTPRDLTPYTDKRMKIRQSYYSNLYTYDITVSFDNPLTNGRVILSATAAETALMKPGRYVFDIEMVIDDDVERILEGIVVVKPNVTY